MDWISIIYFLMDRKCFCNIILSHVFHRTFYSKDYFCTEFKLNYASVYP